MMDTHYNLVVNVSFFIPTSLVNNMAKAPLVAGKIMALPKQRKDIRLLEGTF